MKLVLFGVKAFILVVGTLILLEYSSRIYIHNKYGDLPAPLKSEFSGVGIMERSFGFVDKDFSMGGYSVHDGERTTTDVPGLYKNTIYLLGNSGIFDPQVEDGDTMASVLQRKFNASGFTVRIRNLGTSGEGLDFFLRRERSLGLIPGDMVIIFDSGYVLPQCSTGGSFDNFALYQVLCNEIPDWGYGERNLDYQARINSGKLYAKSHNSQFYHVKQICIGSAPGEIFSLSTNPKNILETCHLNAAGDRETAAQLFDYLTLI